LKEWDLETNTYKEAEDEFEKLIERKKKVNGRYVDETEWVRPDERDLRELTNRRGAILVRNCQLEIMPKDYIEDALSRAQETVEKGARTDPDAWKKIANAFTELNISVDHLTRYLKHPLSESSPRELVALRAIWKSISDGNSTWSEYYSTSGDENLASKSADVLNGIKERYNKSSAGPVVSGQPASDPSEGGAGVLYPEPDSASISRGQGTPRPSPGRSGQAEAGARSAPSYWEARRAPGTARRASQFQRRG